MPFFPHTPESLIRRSDSKNPATTCKGLTSSGRPCRRSLAVSPRSSPSPASKGRNGVLAVIPDVDDEHDGAAAFFCWQHQEQAQSLGNQAATGRTEVVELKERTSIDTLIDRLGVLEVQEEDSKKKRKAGNGGKPLRRETLPKGWHGIPGPLMAVPEDLMAANQHPTRSSRPPHQPSRKPKAEPTVNFSFFCCGSAPDVEALPAPRTRGPPAPEMSEKRSSSQVPVKSPPANHSSSTPAPRTPTRPRIHSQRSPPPTSGSPSQTPTLLSLIPPSLSPQTTSLLLAELAKPLPPSSDPGYIYMFWLTPDSTPQPSQADASSLLDGSISPRRPASDVINRHQRAAGVDTILLKIGRASNVQRRLNEWTRQCNHNLSLIRYYPYHPSSSFSSPSQPPSPLPSPPARPSSNRTLSTPPSHPPHSAPTHEPRKVPHAHRVERLIHLELAAQRVKRRCAGCGVEHREWFEVAASRAGVAGVDAVVRRWVGWAEGQRG